MKKINFTGTGATFIGIWALNLVLTIVTLGLYYPWAKEKMRKYLWNETSFENNRFQFHGTGKEMFKGFIKVYLFVVVLYGLIIMSQLTENPMLMVSVVLIAYLLIIILLPFAIFGAWKYRTSRTSWRGIYASFDGKLSAFVGLFFRDLLFTILSFGIYASWMQVNLRRYILDHTKIGNKRFSYVGDGGNFFGLKLLGTFLSVITLYIYIPAFIRSMFNFHIDNTKLDNKSLKSTLSNGDIYGVLIVNGLLLVFTLGLAFPWVIMRNLKMYMNSIQFPEDIDYDSITQEADNYRDATGDNFLDTLDLGLDL
jgi:uncharacterized membrane protein YjgN (DUF898 family)